MDEKKQEAIVLLNDGEKNDKVGHCNSWPNQPQYFNDLVNWPAYC